MWTYAGDDADRRLKLPRHEAFWLDYWLFLHADETHGLLRSRPIGLKSLQGFVQNLHPEIDKTLIRAIGTELLGYHRLAPYISSPPPSDTPIRLIETSVNGKNKKQGVISSNWISWLNQFQSHARLMLTIDEIKAALGKAVDDRRTPSISFLSRRLAGELADDIASPRILFRRAKHEHLGGGERSFRDKLEKITHLPDQINYTVRFNLAQVNIPTRIAKRKIKGGSVRIIYEQTQLDDLDSSSQTRGAKLVALEVDVIDGDPEHAALTALPTARETLTRLRTTHYIRTQINGPIQVSNSTPSCGTSTSYHFAPQQPFWTPKHGRQRQTPRLPVNFHRKIGGLDCDSRLRFNAMNWHVSQAMSLWAEDVHSAASEVWQAIEGLAGGKQHVAPRVVNEYADRFASDFVDHLVTRISFQAGIYSHRYNGCGWLIRDPKKYSTSEWLREVFDLTSRRWHRKWSNPEPPLLLFDPTAGLLTAFVNKTGSVCSPSWLLPRLTLEFEFLYAIRNAAVHKGERLGSHRWASHLANVGLEAVFDTARKADSSSEPTTTPTP